LILVILSVVTFENTQRLVQTNYWVTHTVEVLGTLNELLSDLQDVETGQRGFVITGKDEFLEPFERGLSLSRKSYAKVQELTADNLHQQRRLDVLLPVMKERVAFAESVIKVRKENGFEPSSQLISSGKDKRMMDDIRKMIAEMIAEENELLIHRSSESEAASKQSLRILVGGTMLAVLFVVGLAFFVIRGVGRNIGTVVQSMRSASAELEAASTQQVKGAKEQASSTTEVSTTVRELVSTSRQIAENAQRVTQSANEMHQSANAGDQTVKGAQEAMDMVRRQVDQIVGHMLSLGKKSQDIGGILEIITELAEQTNILAINATIEAVGAGEGGKRFGVVAAEIRKLADRVGTSTKDIRRLIEEIRTSANTTVMATEDGAKAVDAGARRFAEVTKSFRQIVDHVSATTQAAREIELSTKQQSSAMEQVSGAMIDVTQTARETEASSAQVQQTASDLAKLSADLMRLIERAREEHFEEKSNGRRN
jgi:CHASE3 domain sensor protein